MKKILMGKGAKQIVEICAQVNKGEQVAIVTEPKMLSIAESIATAVNTKEAESTILIMEPRLSDGAEPPKNIAAAMKESDVFISAVYTSITHTHAVVNATKNRSRGVMLTQFEEDMLIDSGVHADFYKAAPICKNVGKILENAEKIHLSTTYGTDLIMSAKGRKSNAMTGIVEKGQFAPVPTIEANVSPLEGSANGKIVCNASIPYIGIGILKESVEVQVENGMITSITGGSEANILKEDLKSKNDKNVYNIAEIGVGLNPNCKFIGLM